jgi:hypothetical protein
MLKFRARSAETTSCKSYRKGLPGRYLFANRSCVTLSAGHGSAVRGCFPEALWCPARSIVDSESLPVVGDATPGSVLDIAEASKVPRLFPAA